MSKRTPHLVALIVAAALLACTLALSAASREAEAAFPGGNGDVAFWSYRPIPGAPCCITAEIYRIGADGSGQTRLTDPPSVNFTGDWSPDGSRMVFTKVADQSRTDDGAIYTMEADGQDQVKVYEFPDGHAGDPQWFPSGEKIAFVGRRDGGSFDLYVLDLGPDGRASGDPVRLTRNPTAEFAPSVSPDGKKIAFTSARGRGTSNDVYVIRANVPEGPDNPAKPLVALNGRDEEPNWSPDGKKVAFQRYQHVAGPRSRIEANVFVVDADGGGRKKLTNSRANYSPSFSPDGGWILFTRGHHFRSGEATITDGVDLWKMRADGSDEQLLVADANGGIWQPLP